MQAVIGCVVRRGQEDGDDGLATCKECLRALLMLACSISVGQSLFFLPPTTHKLSFIDSHHLKLHHIDVEFAQTTEFCSIMSATANYDLTVSE